MRGVFGKKATYGSSEGKRLVQSPVFRVFKHPVIRIAVLTFTVAFIGGTLATLSVYQSSLKQLRLSHEDSLKLIGRVATKGVEPQKLAKIKREEHRNTASFASIQQHLAKTLNGDLRIKYAYIVRPSNDGKPTMLVDMLRDSKKEGRNASIIEIGSPIESPTLGLKESIQRGKQIADLHPFKDRWGEFVSVYSPIMKGKRVIAVVALDLNYAFFDRDLQRLKMSLISGVFASACISLAMAFGAGAYRWRIHRENEALASNVIESSQMLSRAESDLSKALESTKTANETLVQTLWSAGCMIWSGSASCTEENVEWFGDVRHEIPFKWLVTEMLSGLDFNIIWTRMRLPEDEVTWQRVVSFAIKNKMESTSVEYRIVLDSGKRIWFNEQLNFTYTDNEFVRVQALLTDVTEQRSKDEQVRKLAYFDPVTGLINRTRIHEVITEYLREKPRTSVIGIEISNFRNVNESWGPEIGDRLLKEVGHALMESVGNAAVVGRLAGDDFVVIVRDESAVSWLVSKIDEACQKPTIIDAVEVAKICRIGYATAEEGETAVGLIRKSNLALETARKNLAHYPVPYKAEMSFKAKMRVELETAMRQALTDREFYLMFQPIYCNKTRKLVKAEALLRWNSSRFGPVNPSTFIPIAEESDFINVLGNYVIDETARAISKLNKSVGEGAITISMNLSLRQLKNQSTLNSFSSALERWNIHPKNMLIEITESSIMHDASEGTTMLNQLQDRGFSLAIDDFGTGYSSLATLATLPFNCLKIDKRFVDGIGLDRKQEEVLGTVVRLARALNLQIVAEGIESEQQFDFLRKLEVEFSQGYFFAKPLAFEDLECLAKSSHQIAA